MKRYIPLLFLVCSCASKMEREDALVCVQINDRNGLTETISAKERLKRYEVEDFLSPKPYKGVVRIYKRGNGDKKISKLTSYYDNGAVKQYLEVLNARAFGRYRQWHRNGKIAVEAFVVGGPASLGDSNGWIFDGICKAWDEDGSLLSIFNYTGGVLEGEALYYKDNKIRRKEIYRLGKLSGASFEYNEKGEVVFEENYLEGVLNGPSRRFRGDREYLKEMYEDGQLIDGKYYDERFRLISKIENGSGRRVIYRDGVVERKVEYRNGIIDGEVEVFLDGRVVRKYHIKDGEKSGVEIEYFPNGNKKLSINWEGGVLQGFVRTYYEDSTMQSQKEISQNRKNGISSCWYRSGELMFVEEYRDDELISGSYFKKGEKEPESKVVNGNGEATIYDERGNFLKRVKYVGGVPLDEE